MTERRLGDPWPILVPGKAVSGRSVRWHWRESRKALTREQAGPMLVRTFALGETCQLNHLPEPAPDPAGK
jgi:hypothetical protein